MPVCHPATSSHLVGTTRFTPIAAPSTGSREASVWRVEIEPGSPAVAHSLTAEEIIVVLEGMGEVTIDGAAEPVQPGAAIVVPRGASFSLVAVGDRPLSALAYLPVGGQAVLPGEEPFTPPWAM